jgi:tetratricopeptide (TPR) repeat protein
MSRARAGWRRAAVAAAAVLMALPPQGPALRPAAAQPAPAPAPAADSQSRLASIVLAKGIKQASLFGQGEITPVDPSTTFVNTDLPYAVIKATSMKAGTEVAIRVSDPTGPAFDVSVKPSRGSRGAFDFALPLYLLGTDLETHTGRWSLQVSFNGQPQTPQAAFDWEPSSGAQLKSIHDELAAAPTNPDLHWRYGAALALLGARAEAVPELENAIRLDPHYALYYITLGRVYEQMGQRPDAAKMFRTALAQHGSAYDSVYARWAQAHLDRLEGR